MSNSLRLFYYVGGLEAGLWRSVDCGEQSISTVRAELERMGYVTLVKLRETDPDTLPRPTAEQQRRVLRASTVRG